MLKARGFYIFLLLSVVTIAIMAPIASHDYIPRYNDYVSHLENIIQAKQAILGGNFFWLRAAPTVLNAWLYPEFQFYSPTPYTFAGYLALILAHNPLDPYKFGIGLLVILGAWYCYKLYVFLFKNEIAALLGAVLYLFSPYLLININVRGDFSEACTQGLLPVALYYAFRLFYQDRWGGQKIYFMLASIFSFYVLNTSHLISFVYASLLAFILFFFLALQQKKWTNLLFLLCSFTAAIFMAFWYWVPVVEVGRFLNLGAQQLFSPFSTNWFTELPTLLSPKGINPQPRIDIPLYPGIGLPLTLSFGYWIYKLYFEVRSNQVTYCDQVIVRTSVWVFFLAFFMLWSPFNFWKVLPHELYVLQYTFRLLTQVMWLGGLVFVACITDLFQGALNRRHFVIGSFLICLSGAGWMYSNYTNTTTDAALSPLKVNAVTDVNNYTVVDYFIPPAFITTPAVDNLKLNKNLMDVFTTQKSCQRQQLQWVCTLNVKGAGQYFQLPILYYPDLLSIRANGQALTYAPSEIDTPVRNYLVASIYLAPGHYVVTSEFVGIVWANRVSELVWFVYGFFVVYWFCFLRRPRVTSL
jgi:hypothetical protein